MRLLLPLRAEWSLQQMPIGLRVEVAPGLRFLIDPAQPVPFNARAWGDRVVFGSLPPARVSVQSVEDRVTDEGWPFTYVISDELGIDGQPVERRIHAIVRIAEHAVVVTARSKSAAAIDAFQAELRIRVTQSRTDFSDVVTSLDQIWSGLEVRDASVVAPRPPTDQSDQ
jgi:hypothetical protein